MVDDQTEDLSGSIIYERHPNQSLAGAFLDAPYIAESTGKAVEIRRDGTRERLVSQNDDVNEVYAELNAQADDNVSEENPGGLVTYQQGPDEALFGACCEAQDVAKILEQPVTLETLEDETLEITAETDLSVYYEGEPVQDEVPEPSPV